MECWRFFFLYSSQYVSYKLKDNLRDFTLGLTIFSSLQREQVVETASLKRLEEKKNLPFCLVLMIASDLLCLELLLSLGSRHPLEAKLTTVTHRRSASRLRGCGLVLVFNLDKMLCESPCPLPSHQCYE